MLFAPAFCQRDGDGCGLGVPDLYFGYDGYDYPDETKGFMNYVERVLLLRQRSSIRKFDILFHSPSCDKFRVNSWISTLVTGKLQELTLDIRTQRPLVFPLSIYTCESLIVLRITVWDSFGYELPTSRISLPNLKLLDLRSVIFPNEYMTTQFFSSCPVLEHLTLYNSSWVNNKIVLISVPSLKFFEFAYPCLGKDRDTFDVAFKICAPNLERFLLYSVELLPEYVLGDMPSILHAKISFDRDIELLTREKRCHNATMLLKGLVSVKALEISADILKTRACSENYLITDVMETMPHCLLSSVKKVRFDSYFGCKEEFYLIKSLLKNVVALESMTIVIDQYHWKNFQSKLIEDRKHILMLPRSSLSCVVEIFDNWATMSLLRLDDETNTLKMQQ